jgi:hypothetical protein
MTEKPKTININKKTGGVKSRILNKKETAKLPKPPKNVFRN